MVNASIEQKLQELRQLSLEKKNIDLLAKYVSDIHSIDIKDSKLPVYNGLWVKQQLLNQTERKDYFDILYLLEKFYEIDMQASIDTYHFITWNSPKNRWQEKYRTGHIGSYVWDLAAIMSYINRTQYNDLFLEQYMKYSSRAPSLSAIYTNLYYIKTVQLISNKEYQEIQMLTDELINNDRFLSDILSSEAVVRLNILGY